MEDAETVARILNAVKVYLGDYMKKDVSELLLQYMREELAELEEFRRPKRLSKRILKRIEDWFTFPGIRQIQLMDIRLKHLKRQIELLEKHGY